jgi:hypothetical protein
MNTQTKRWAVPAAAAVLLLAGCGQTVAADAGSKLTVPKSSTEICNAPTYARQGAPEGVCGVEFDRLISEQVEDDLSLKYLHQERLQRVQR